MTRATHLLLSVLALTAGACSSTCSSDSERREGTSDAASDASTSGVEVLDPGRTPRVTLRVNRWRGQRYGTKLVAESTLGALGAAPVKLPTLEMELRAQVLRGSADPQIHPSQDGEKLRLVEEQLEVRSLRYSGAHIPAPLLTEGNSALALLVGTTARQLLTEDAEVHALSVDLVGGERPSQTVKQAVDEAWDAQRHFPLRLPPMPVGVGARWRFVETLDLHGVRLLQVADASLVGVRPKSVSLRLRIKQHAPRQKIPHPMDPKRSALLEIFRGDGEGELTLDRVTAVTLEGRLTTTAHLSLSSEGPTGREKLSLVSVNTIRSKGELQADAPSPGTDAVPEGAPE